MHFAGELPTARPRFPFCDLMRRLRHPRTAHGCGSRLDRQLTRIAHKLSGADTEVIWRNFREMRAAAALTGLLLLSVSAQNQAQAQTAGGFYKGKSVTLAIGFSVGGGYDLYARPLARHIGKHIPGNPTIVPQNMAGAGSLRAANFIYTAAPKDGTV